MSLIERIYNYAVDIVDGKIMACRKHKQSCQRFLDDLSQLEDENYPYYFDGNELYDFYDWAKMFKHKEGILAGQYIELTDFQLFLVANIFCWKRKKNEARRFKRAYIQLARKQGKSQLQALIASYVGFLSEEKQQIYIAGVTKEQSKIVFQQILDQINDAEFLKGKYKDSYGVITHKKSGSIITPLSKEAKKTGDGKFPSLSIIDEYHSHPTSEIFDVLLSGMIGRKNALQVVITTAGLDLSVPCYTEYQYCSKVLDVDNPIDNDEYFIMICEVEPEDDIKDERVWIKANPIVCTYEEGIEDLRGRLKVALEVPEKMTEFLTKHMNIWVQRKSNGYMDMQKWKACGGKFDFEKFRGCECIIGIDLSAKIDLTSLGFIFKQDDIYYVLSHSFIPEDTLATKMRTDRVPYDLWERQGWLTATTGAVVDYAFIKSYINNIIAENNIKVTEICCDPWNGSQFMQDMEQEGFTVIEIRQGIATLGSPTKNFREEVYLNRVRHNNNPVLTWAVGNAVTKQDANENIMLDKSKATERIDPIASLINGHVRAMQHSTEIDINKHILSGKFSF